MTVHSTHFIPADEIKGSCGVCGGWGHYAKDCPKAKGGQKKLSVPMFARPHLVSSSSSSEEAPPSGDPDGIQIIHSPPPPNSDVSIWLQETVAPTYRNHTAGSVQMQHPQSDTPIVAPYSQRGLSNPLQPSTTQFHPTKADIEAVIKEELLAETQRLQQTEQQFLSERDRYTTKLAQLCEKEKNMQLELEASIELEKSKRQQQIDLLIEKHTKLELEMQVKIEEARRTSERNAEALLMQRQEELDISNRKFQSDLEIQHEKQEQAVMAALLLKEKENSETEIALQARISAAEEAEAIKSKEMDAKQAILEQKTIELQQIESKLTSERLELDARSSAINQTEQEQSEKEQQLTSQEETLKQLSGKLQEEGLAMQASVNDMLTQRQEIMARDSEYTKREVALKELNLKLHEMQVCLEDRNSTLDLRERELASKIQRHQEEVSQQQESLAQQASKMKDVTMETDLYCKEQRDSVEKYRQITERELTQIRESLAKQEEIAKIETTAAQQTLLESERALEERQRLDIELKRRLTDVEEKEETAKKRTIELEKQILELEEKTNAMRELKETVTEQQKALLNDTNEVDAKQRTAEKHFREAEQILQTAHRKSADLDHEKAEFRNQKEELAAAQHKISSLQKQLHIATSETEEQSLECDGLRLKYADLEIQLSETIKAKCSAEESFTSVNREKTSLENTLEGIKQKVKGVELQFEAQNKQKAAEYQQQSSTILDLRNENKKLETQIQELTTTVTKKELVEVEIRDQLKMYQQSGKKPWPLNPILLSSSEVSAPRTIPAMMNGISPHSSEWSKLDVSMSVSPCDSPLGSQKHILSIDALNEQETRTRGGFYEIWESECQILLQVSELLFSMLSDPAHLSASVVTSPVFRIDRSPQSPSLPFGLSLPPLPPSGTVDNSDAISVGSRASFNSRENSDPKLLIYAVTTDMQELLSIHGNNPQLKRISDICITTTKRFERLCEDYEQSRKNVAVQSSKAHQYKAEQWYVDSHLHTALEDNKKTNQILQDDQDNIQWLESRLQQVTHRLEEVEADHEGCGKAVVKFKRSEQYLSKCISTYLNTLLVERCFNNLCRYYLLGIRFRLGKVERDALRNLEQETRRCHLTFRYNKWVAFAEDAVFYRNRAGRINDFSDFLRKQLSDNRFEPRKSMVVNREFKSLKDFS